MYNDYSDEFETDDLDDNIGRKEALLEEVKQIPVESSWNDVFRKISDLKKRWRQVPYGESAFEESLEHQFEECLNTFYEKRNEGYRGNQQLKQELVNQAVKLSTSTDWNSTSDEMNELMSQWKAVGSSGKDIDDALWETFNTARQTFYDRKRENWENRKVMAEDARLVKQDLVKEAIALQKSEDWKQTSDQYRALMDAWKQAGNAGKGFDDQLWSEFHGARQAFYDRRNAYYEEIRGEQDQKYEQKKALIEEAKVIVSSKEYTKEQTTKMKELNITWKKIGSCGKDHENQVWQEFRSLADAYFAGLKEFNEQKHREWRQRMLNARAQKLELIQAQKRQIKYLQSEMVGLFSERAILDMEDDIADKEDFIKELEEQLVDIEKTLNK